MSVMSAAEAGQPADASPEIFPRGPRMAEEAVGQDGAGQRADHEGGRSAPAGPYPPARHERRLRLVATELRVTQVRVAREVSARTARTVRAGAPGASAQQVSTARVSTQWVSASGMSARRVSASGMSARRVRVQRASAGRVSGPGTSVRPGGLRLTRRGRRVLAGLVMLVIISAAMLLWASVAGGAQAPGPGVPLRSAYQGMTQIVVQPGETLWSIAAAAEPSASPWTVVQQITDMNALNGTQIQAGQLLWVPRG